MTLMECLSILVKMSRLKDVELSAAFRELETSMSLYSYWSQNSRNCIQEESKNNMVLIDLICQKILDFLPTYIIIIQKYQSLKSGNLNLMEIKSNQSAANKHYFVVCP